MWAVGASAQQASVPGRLPIADPHVLCYDGIYYAYGTGFNRGFQVYYSDDLENWHKGERPALDKEDVYGEKWFWAPEVYYVEAKQKFYLYYSAEEHIAVAVADLPMGPFRQEVKRPMLEEKAIDSSLFIDDDGTPYLYFVRFTGGNVIWMAELEEDFETIKTETLTQCLQVGEPWETVMASVAEGPSVLKRDGVYYLIYSANHYESPDYGVGFATASSPFGPWEKYPGNPVLQKPEPDLVGTGHGAYFTDNDGNLRYIFHAHYSTDRIHPRTSYIADMELTDGVIKMGRIIRPVVVQ
ncbi:MAG: glycoside hydrolase family 43 protein [Alistipes sp.]|nr:glycoside hydrolase family 43 protein [Alistipes sp.]